jgi:toxin ParE1/3/4
MSRFTLSPLAQTDLDAIWEYIGIQNDHPDAAHRLIERLFETFRFLASEPAKGEARQDLEDLVPGVRSFSVGNYVIYFQPTRQGIRIGRVLHGARDARTLFSRERQ